MNNSEHVPLSKIHQIWLYFILFVVYLQLEPGAGRADINENEEEDEGEESEGEQGDDEEAEQEVNELRR